MTMKQTKLLYKLIRRVADGVGIVLVLLAALFATRAL
jgi:hypothetical protein